MYGTKLHKLERPRCYSLIVISLALVGVRILRTRHNYSKIQKNYFTWISSVLANLKFLLASIPC